MVLSGAVAADDMSEIVFKPVPETGELEIGFWEGEGNGLGGHIRMTIEPFSAGDVTFKEPRLNMNLFQLALPYDLRAINDRTIDCESKEFYFGTGGGLHLDSVGRERIPMKPKSLRFLRTGNESIRLTMTGLLPIAGTGHPFVVESELRVGRSYGAPDGQVIERILDEALQIVGIPDLPRRMNRTFYRGGSRIWLLLEPANGEVLGTWMKRLLEHPGPEAITLPSFVSIPDFWFYQEAESPSSELPRFVDVYPEFRKSWTSDFGQMERRLLPEALGGVAIQTLRSEKRLSGRMLFYQVAEERDGWIVLFPDEPPHGKIFIFCVGNE